MQETQIINKQVTSQQATTPAPLGQVERLVMPDLGDVRCRIEGKKYDLDCLDKNIHKAAELALELKRFCLEHNIPPSAEIAGVAWNGQCVREQAYIEGKKYEKTV